MDDSTAVLHLDKTYVTYQMWDYILPQHLEAESGRGPGADRGRWITSTTRCSTRTPHHARAMGRPLRDQRLPARQFDRADAHPHWPGETPAIKHVVIRLVENTASLQANLLSGDVDMSPSGIGITTDQAVTLERNHARPFQFFYRKGLSYERIDMQQENKPLARPAGTRGAAAGARPEDPDRPPVTGHATLAETWINELEPNYTPDVPTYPYDPAKARALLRRRVTRRVRTASTATPPGTG